MDTERIADIRATYDNPKWTPFGELVVELCDALQASQAETQEYRTKAALHIKAIAKSHDEARAAMNEAIVERDALQAELSSVLAEVTELRRQYRRRGAYIRWQRWVMGNDLKAARAENTE